MSALVSNERVERAGVHGPEGLVPIGEVGGQWNSGISWESHELDNIEMRLMFGHERSENTEKDMAKFKSMILRMYVH